METNILVALKLEIRRSVGLAIANLFAMVLANLLPNLAVAAEATAFALTVTPAKGLVGPQLRMELKNISSDSKVIFQGALPWVDGVSGARLVGFSGNFEEGDEALTPIRPAGALFHSLTEIVIDSGASLIGNVDLEERFPGINELLRKGPIFVYWVYRPLDASLVKHQELTGAVFLQRHSK